MKQTNLDIYGSEPIPWSRALKQLEALTEKSAEQVQAHPDTIWLATTRPDGRPHVTGIGALWVDDKFYFTSGPETRKSRNLAENPECVLSVALTGLDLVVEGRAERVTDAATLQRLAQCYADQGWPAQATTEGLTAPYSAPSAGRPPWYLYAMKPVTAFGVATAEPNGATRWEFDA